jgi:antitoxin component of MazEF toxin-antitoxin module
MAKKKATKKGPFDAKKFLKMVSEKASPEDYEKAFGFKTKAQIDVAHYKALVQTGGLEPAVVGKRAGRTASVDRVKIGKSGKISLSKDMVAEFGFKEGDEFKVKKRGDNIITLKKVGAEAETETEDKTED